MFIVFLLLAPLPSECAEMDLEALLALLEARDAMIESASMTYTVTPFTIVEDPESGEWTITEGMGNSPTGREKYRKITWAKSGNRLYGRWENVTTDRSRISYTHFDGEKAIRHAGNLQDVIFDNRFVKPNLRLTDPRVLFSHIHGMPIYEFLPGGPHGKPVEMALEGTERIEGVECLILVATLHIPQRESHWITRIYFDPTRDYTIMRITDEIPHSYTRWEIQIPKTIPISSGGQTFHFPSEAEFRVFMNERFIHMEKFHLDELEINCDLPDSLFSPTLSPGTRVEDNILNTSYTLGRDGERVEWGW